MTNSDIKIYLSGGASNTDTDASLGGAISITAVVTNVLHNLFDRVTGGESRDGDVEYRAVFVKNTHATETAHNLKMYISSQTSNTSTSLKIAPADETGSPIETIADEGTAPSGPVFVVAADLATGVTLGALAPGESKGVWIEWTVDAGATSTASDEASITIKSDDE